MPQVAEYRFPSDRRYDPETHLWVKPVTAETVQVGVDDFEQEAAGTYQRVLLKEPGEYVAQGDELMNLESAKFVGSKPAPIAGEVTAVNHSVVNHPQQINTAPYESWLVRLTPDDPTSVTQLIGDGEITTWAQAEIDEEQRRTTAVERERCPQD